MPLSFMSPHVAEYMTDELRAAALADTDATIGMLQEIARKRDLRPEQLDLVMEIYAGTLAMMAETTAMKSERDKRKRRRDKIKAMARGGVTPLGSVRGGHVMSPEHFPVPMPPGAYVTQNPYGEFLDDEDDE